MMHVRSDGERARERARQEPPVLRIDGGPRTLDEVLALARGACRPELDPDPAFRARLRAGRAALERALEQGRAVYGVTTGVGASVTTQIPPEARAEMPLHLLRFHGCGTGRLLDDEEAAGVVAVRLVSLARGWSGVRSEVLERLVELLARRILPCIPEEGSVGASGDLTPLSYLAALVVGEREARVDGEVQPAARALEEAGLAPLRLEPKESLALMNGTSVMTAIGCLAWDRARRLARLACAVTAMVSRASSGNPAHFDARLFAQKPHAGTRRAAARIREALGSAPRRPPARLQDRYSIRCAPHVIGVLEDALDFHGALLEVEVNGVDDNPLVDPETGDVLHGGNFYGGHVAFAMDGLKAAVAGVADLLDRQVQLLCAPETSGGLPPNLTDGTAQHGFKAMQISTSALAAEALKLTMPAASFSRSTEGHNQDKVSMGTIAARDARRVVELTETVAAIALLAGCQGLDLRGDGAADGPLGALRDAVRGRVGRLETDRRQDGDIAAVLALLRDEALPLGA